MCLLLRRLIFASKPVVPASAVRTSSSQNLYARTFTHAPDVFDNAASAADRTKSPQAAPDDAKGRWEYYRHWVTALDTVVRRHGLLEEGYVNPEDRD